MSAELIGQILLVAACLGMGGILKGATGAGAPVLAVPALVVLFDVHFAILIMLVPNIVTNSFQAWKFRAHLPNKKFLLPLLFGGAVGIIFGTVTLVSLSSQTLSLLVALSVFGYIGLKLAKPDWKIGMPLGEKLALPAGIAAGFLQGASGLSAPVSLTFLNAMALPRPVFIATVSTFFCVFTVAQFLALWQGGLLVPQTMIYSLFALIPLAAAMPLGARLAKSVKPATFDKLILVLLAFIAVRLLLGVFI